MNALIIANGDHPSDDLLCSLIPAHPLVILTDGAANRFAGRLPTAYVIGDFDSIDKSILSSVPAELRIPVFDQEQCDLEKAIQFAISSKATSISIVGAGGGRLDAIRHRRRRKRRAD